MHTCCGFTELFRQTATLARGIAIIAILAISLPAHAEYTNKLRVSANGQLLDLLLKPSQVTHNTSVYSLTGQSLHVPVRTYEGKVQGDPHSWVRLTKTANTLDGVISRFDKRFRITQNGNNPIQIEPLAGNHNSDITITHSPLKVSNRIVAAIPPITHTVDIGIVVDSGFNALHKGRGLAYAMGLINSIDGIYQEEFGVSLRIKTAINIQDPSSDPLDFGAVEVESMLRSFRQFRLSNRQLDASVSLVHLFTGNQPTDEPVGLAWIDTACRPDGYDVGLSTKYRHDVLLASHEIAHNLGALHDTDTACAVSTDKVMWPYISAGTSQHFSRCTVNSVKSSLQNSCHAPLPSANIAWSEKDLNTGALTPLNAYQDNSVDQGVASDDLSAVTTRYAVTLLALLFMRQIWRRRDKIESNR